MPGKAKPHPPIPAPSTPKHEPLPKIPDGPVLTRKEAAQMLRCGLTSIDKMIGAGTLRAASHLGLRKKMILRSEVEKYIERRFDEEAKK